jgi:hypothetical protein
MRKNQMHNYLSFGGGVNSVAMMLLLLDEGMIFESVYVWMPDYPETHEYIMMLEDKGYPIKIVHAMPTSKLGKAFDFNLYQYCINAKMMPGFKRWCTFNYKVQVLQKYYKRPCFEMVGISTDEIKRAILRCEDGIERRYPLVERDISREDCKQIILSHGLPLPIKSGCFFCPYQRIQQWKSLRRNHPDLFCKARELEKLTGRNLPLSNKPLESIINEPDIFLFDELNYPPCQCGL